MIYMKTEKAPPPPAIAYRFVWEDTDGDELDIIVHGTSRHDAREAWRRMEEACRKYGHAPAATRPTVTRVA